MKKIKSTILTTCLGAAILSGCSTTEPITEKHTVAVESNEIKLQNVKTTDKTTDLINFITQASQSLIDRIDNHGNNIEGGFNFQNLSLNDAKIIFDLDSDKVNFSTLNITYPFYSKFSDIDGFVNRVIKKDATKDDYNKLIITTMKDNIINYVKNLSEDKTGLLLTDIQKNKMDIYSNMVNQLVALSAYEARLDFDKQIEQISKSKTNKKPVNNINNMLKNNIKMILISLQKT